MVQVNTHQRPDSQGIRIRIRIRARRLAWSAARRVGISEAEIARATGFDRATVRQGIRQEAQDRARATP